MHNLYGLLATLSLCVILSACASTESESPALLDTSRVDQELLATATSIQQSIRVMEQTTNALAVRKMTPQEAEYAKRQMAQVPPGMEVPMTTTTYASLRAVVADAAAMANYRFEEYGKRKKLYLTMDTTMRPVVDILRDAGAQVKGQAWVCVYPSPKANQYSNGVVAIKYEGGCDL
ncbi:DotD/TraH family lipoprotein [Alteromonas antoniana]|uniref:DotD/TraH family lipoprotein n=1 Tax=Alteromonas antoniana TaxID=2803813 RepID=UPI001C466B64|nr:DotD/TraH family lipoprotein [Alteromonas antoniana]